MYLKDGVEHVPYLVLYFLTTANSDTGILYFSLNEIKH